MSINDKKPGLALFDFDGTLVEFDSFGRFALFARGIMRCALAAIRCAPSLIGMKAGIINASDAKEKLFKAVFEGMDYQEFCKRGEEFAAVIEAHKEERHCRLLQEHLEKGDRVYIISASMAEWIRPWARLRGVAAENVIGTRLEIGSDGRLTGNFANANCKGEEKVRRLKEVEPDLTGKISVYTDDKETDRPMLGLSFNEN